jgi:hypothetical protein
MSHKGNISIEQVELYEELQSHLVALAAEVTVLAKKAPDAPLNQFKIKIVNERLRAANTLLTGIHKPFESFETFDETDLPSASDVSMVISQYINSLEGWRSANVVNINYSWYWNTGNAQYRAESPTRFRKGGS